MADKRISQLAERTDIANNDVVAIVASGATVTNKATISSIQSYLQGALDVGVESVGVTIGESGSDVNVVGSPITTSGNITINIPSAGVSERGVLTSEDYTSFLNKQNTITLTTSGTSGDATFDGSLLNIPNYTTDTSNLVPYTGANQTVNLGFNALLGGNLSVLGASENQGGRIAFKQATNVSTGGGETTSISTFGTNTMTFNFAQPTGSKAFSFNVQDIELNVAGGRVYTMPDASGTLALTSDLNSYLPLTGGTLTGALNGTSAVFSGALTLNGANNVIRSGNELRFNRADNAIYSRIFDAGSSFTFDNLNGNGFSFQSAGTPQFSIASTGAATFSSSVTFNQSSADNGFFQIFGNNSVLNIGADKGGGATLKYNSNGNLDITPRSGFNSIFTNGNVGIGTTEPGQKLEVAGAGAVIRLRDSTGGVVDFGSDSTGTYWRNFSNNTFRFLTAAGTEQIRITSTGNVGIGTTSPSAKLEVNGAIKTSSPSGSAAQPFKIGSVSTTTDVYGGQILNVEINGLNYRLMIAEPIV